MKVAVLGAGAMGSLFGGMLAQRGHHVWLLDIWKEHVETIGKRGLRITGLSGDRVIKSVKAASSAQEVGSVDLVIVFVKSTVTEEAVRSASSLFGPETLALTLQNGIGNVEQIARVIGSRNVLAGTTAQGATVLGPGEIYHAGQGPTAIGELMGAVTPRVKNVAAIFNDAGIQTSVSDNVMGLIWGKLLVNLGINALTALTGLRNGQLLDHPETVEILELAVLEGFRVCKAKGISLPYEDPVAHTKEVAMATSSNISSMLQDVKNRRKTEIEMINGAVVREAQAMGIETPVNKVLTNLVRVLERSYIHGSQKP
ncbi:MAG: 2-dehydropantoate 2-reductase [bacterium]